MTFGDYAITEAGFGADLGAEKFYDIKCRKAGITPKLTVLVVTARALKMHGGVPQDKIKEPNLEALQKGIANMDKHLRNLESFGQTVLVAFNRYGDDTQEEIDFLRTHCAEKGVAFAVNNALKDKRLKRWVVSRTTIASTSRVDTSVGHTTSRNRSPSPVGLLWKWTKAARISSC